MTVNATFLGLEDEFWGCWTLDHPEPLQRVELACCSPINMATFDPANATDFVAHTVIEFRLDRFETEARRLVDPRAAVYRRVPI